MPPQYLAEGLKGSFPFIADTKNIVVEALENGGSRTRIPGRFSVCDEANGNGRRYSKPVWEKNLQPGSALMKSIQENATWGLLEHPKDGQITLQSPICIRTTKAELRESKDTTGKPIWEVIGEISILNPKLVPEAARLTAMVEEGYCPRVSSRGFGSLVRAADGIDDVQDDYVCEGWDVVMKPSFESAILQPQPETKKAQESAPKTAPVATISEAAPVVTNGNPATSVTTIITTPGQPPVVTSTDPVLQASVASSAKPPTNESSQEKAMTITEIKSQIASFRNVDAAKLPPQRFAEGMSQLGALHQNVADHLAENPKNSWQAQQLHEEIKNIETSWSETQLMPGKKATKLQENNIKLMQVVKAVAQTGINLKKKIGEAVKQQGRQAALLAEVTERGQSWRQLAKESQQAATTYKRRFMMSAEALQQLATKYKTDMTEMGRAHLQLEFKEKLATAPEIAAMLKEAKRPKALIPIRLALEGKITQETASSILTGKVSLDETLKGLKGASAPAPGATGDPKKQTAAPPVAEGKKGGEPAKASPAAPVGEGVTVLSTKPGDPREINEAVGMVTRLSKSITG